MLVAAGNDGKHQRIGSPAAADAALAVGSVTKQDERSYFSSRGPRIGDHAIKPDIAAPGSQIVAARAPGTPGGDYKPVGAHYARMDGTSMASPHVAGAAALLAAAHPDWRAPQLKAALMSSARILPELTPAEQGAGRLDVATAAAQTLTADTGALSAYLRWPRPSAEVTREAVFRNTGSAPVTLALTAALTDAAKQPAPAGTLRLGAEKLTVPAGSTARVRVVFAPARAGDGRFQGYLTATGGGQRVSVPLALWNEPESYDARVRVLDSRGAPASDQPVLFLSTVGDLPTPLPRLTGADGTVTVRLPKGEYQPAVTVYEQVEGRERATLVPLPVQRMDRDRSLLADARKGVPAQLTGDRRPTAAETAVTYVLNPAAMLGSYLTLAGPAGDVRIAPVTGGYARSQLVVTAHLRGGPAGAEWHDHLFSRQAGAGLAAPKLVSTEASTAPVRLRLHTPKVTGVRAELAISPEGDFSEFRVPFAPHSARTDRFTPGTWSLPLFLTGPGDTAEPGVFLSYERTFRAGRAAGVELLDGVSGASPATATRFGDRLVFYLDARKLATSAVGFRESDVPLSTARLILSRDGRQVATSDTGSLEAEVPVAAAGYRLRLESGPAGKWLPYARQVSAEWGFRSARAAGSEAVWLPALSVAFPARLSLTSTVPAGRITQLPLTVARADVEGRPVSVRRLTLEVSYSGLARPTDWQRTRPVQAADGSWSAPLTPPVGARFVSLRAAVVDTEGNTVTQTVVRAFGVG